MKNLLKVVGFITVLFLVLNILTRIYVPKGEDYNKAPYYESPNSMDVVFIGSSHVHWGIHPLSLWDNFGIPAVNYVVTGVDLKNTYYMLKELISYHKPKVVVIDVFRINDKENAVLNTHRVSNALNFSWNKIQMINSNDSLKTLEDRLNYYFPLYLYHTRKLEEHDFSFKYNNPDKGHIISFDRISGDHHFSDITEVAELDSLSKHYIERVLELAENNDIKLVFIKTPNLKSDENYIKEWNAVEDLVTKKGVPFINFNKEKLFKEVGLIYNQDIANDSKLNGHLNHSGAEKVTLFLGKVLQKKYNLENKKNWEEFSHLDVLNNLIKERIASLQPFVSDGRNILNQGKSMVTGDYLQSSNKRFKLLLQGDGNLVLMKDDNVPIWASGTVGKPVVELYMQADGNLVLYDQNRKAYWSTSTVDKPGSNLILQDDGNLVLYQENKAIWATSTVQP